MSQSDKKDFRREVGSMGTGQTHVQKQEGEKSSGQKYEELRDLSKVSASRLVDIAREVGEHLSPQGLDIKINQIRRFLDEVRQIEAELKSDRFSPDRIILLRPKLAYAAGRERKVKELMNVLDPAIQSASHSKDNFIKLLRLIEGIVAYHRYYGGSN